MIVQRITHTAKPGKLGEIIELLKGFVEGSGASGRVLTPGWVNWDTVQVEVEWETEEDMDKFWTDLDRSLPGVAEAFARINDLRESGSTDVKWETW